MIRGWLTLTSLVVAVGCMKTSATYCAKHGADDPENCPPTDATVASCTSNADCADTPGSLVCDLGTSLCVECTAQATAACVDAEPVCGTDNACRACRAHAECASELCLPDGRCASESDVAYVSGLPMPGSSSECTKTDPCDKVQKALAVTPAKLYVKIAGAVNEPVLINDRDITLLGATGATIANSSNDTINLEVRGTSDVAVHDLQIGDGAGRTFGVKLDAENGSLLLDRVRVSANLNGAISAVRGRLSVHRSTISDNTKGGIEVLATAGVFDIRNNFIYSNGAGAGMYASYHGGVLITNDVGGKVEFNTIAFNNGNGFQNHSGLACYGPMNSANGNLVYGNRDGVEGPDTAKQIGGNCVVGTSLALATGDLGFKNPSPSTPDFHLTATSPLTVLDAGGACETSNAIDIDGQPRAYGVACDLGADELMP